MEKSIYIVVLLHIKKKTTYENRSNKTFDIHNY